MAIAVMGPTAAGKTDLAIALGAQVNGEIISVDSTQVYRGLDIGSAKPSVAERRRAPHRLIDIRDPAEPYSAADFCLDAKREIDEVVGLGKVPLLVGGTMLYFKALLEGLSAMPAADQNVRAQIAKEAAECGWPHMHSLLREVDPEAATMIHPNHSQRLSRALEVYRISGRPWTSFHDESGGGLAEQFQWVQIAVAPRDRKVLHATIARRFELMLRRGLLDEVRELMARDAIHKGLPAMRAVGYRQAWEFLEGACDADELRQRAVAATRQLAKRQLTWLRSWRRLHWLDTLDKRGNLYSIRDLTKSALKILPKRAI